MNNLENEVGRGEETDGLSQRALALSIRSLSKYYTTILTYVHAIC